MVEFGEQLRRAREKKGMTQQSLAEKLYVTRQSVSRWECGDRYPDLLTTKKISEVLDVSLDDLLSGKEMEKVVERNPIIESKMGNIIMIMIYAVMLLDSLVSTIDIICRLSYPIPYNGINDSMIKMLTDDVLGLIIQVIVFAFGLINVIRKTFSVKKVGVLITIFFITKAMFENVLNVRVAPGIHVMMCIIVMAPYLLGAAAAFIYYMQNKKRVVPVFLIYLAGIWGIIKDVYILLSAYSVFEGMALISMIRRISQICVFGLIIYQTYILYKKRQSVEDINKDKDNCD